MMYKKTQEQIVEILELAIDDWNEIVTINYEYGLCNYFVTVYLDGWFVEEYLQRFAPPYSYLYWFPLNREGHTQRLLLLRKALEYYKTNSA